MKCILFSLEVNFHLKISIHTPKKNQLHPIFFFIEQIKHPILIKFDDNTETVLVHVN